MAKTSAKMDARKRAIKDGKRREFNLPRMSAAVRRMLRELDACSISTLNKDENRPVHIAEDAEMHDTAKIARYCPHHTSNPEVAFIAELRKWAIQGERLLQRAAHHTGETASAETAKNRKGYNIWEGEDCDEETEDEE